MTAVDRTPGYRQVERLTVTHHLQMNRVARLLLAGFHLQFACVRHRLAIERTITSPVSGRLAAGRVRRHVRHTAPTAFFTSEELRAVGRDVFDRDADVTVVHLAASRIRAFTVGSAIFVGNGKTHTGKTRRGANRGRC